MNFQLTDDQKQLQKSARRYAREKLPELAENDLARELAFQVPERAVNGISRTAHR